MVTDGNQISGGKHAIEYTDTELQCCTSEIYMMSLANATSIK